MIRWLKKKCSKRSTPSFGKKLPRSPRVEEPTENDYHIYEEIEDFCITPQEVAYAVVSLDKKFDDVTTFFDIDCPICTNGCLDVDIPCACHDDKSNLSHDALFSMKRHSSAVMTIDKSLPTVPFKLAPGQPKYESFSYEDSSSGYISNSSSSLDIGIDDDFIMRLDNMHKVESPQRGENSDSLITEIICLERQMTLQNRRQSQLPFRSLQTTTFSSKVECHVHEKLRRSYRFSEHDHLCYDI